MMEEDQLAKRPRLHKFIKWRKFGIEFQPNSNLNSFLRGQEDNASNLAIDLHQMNYAVEPVRRSSGNGKWLINGWTHRMNSMKGR